MAAENEAGRIALGLVLDTEPLQEQAPEVEKIANKVGKSVGEAVDKGSSDSLRKSSDKIIRNTEKTGKESGQRFTAGFKRSIDAGSGGIIATAAKLAGKLGAIFAAKKVFDFGKSAVEAGSDLAEVQNVVDSTFTSLNRKVDEFAQNAATQYGLSETMAKRYAGTFGAMGKAFGFSEQKAYDMGTALTGLAGDVASFYNITQDEAYTKLKSVFTGETESLKDLGVVMTQTALDDYALRSGLGKTVQQMTEAEKVTLRYGFVMDQLSTASGDFARTSDGWANQVRILTLQFQSLKAAIGQGLIAALNPVIHALNRFMGVLVKAANLFSAFMQKLFGVKAAAGAMGDAVSGAIDNITGGTADAINGINGVGNATSGAAKKATKAVQQLKRTLEGFDQITKVKEAADNADAGAGGAGTGGSVGGADAGAMADYAAATDAAGESMSRLDAIIERFKEKLEPARKALERLREQLKKLGGHLGEGLKWLYDNVLVPLADWTITEVIPRFFDTLANVVDIFDSILVALQPLWQWFWDNVLKPIAEWTAGAFLSMWDKINDALGKFADWCKENPEKIQAAAVVLGSFAAALGAVAAIGTIAGVIGKIVTFGKTVFGIISSIKSFAGLVSTVTTLLGGPMVVAIAAAIAIGILLWKNWDKVKAVGEKLWKSIKKAVADIKNRFKDIRTKLEGFVKTVKEKFQNIIDKVKEFWDAIKKIPENVKTTISLAKNRLFDKIKKEWDSIKDKTAEIKAKVCQFTDEIKSKIIEFEAKLTSWIDSLKEKIVNFTANFTLWKDQLEEKAVNFTANFTLWKDQLKEKAVNFTANFTLWKDQLKEKAVNFTANFTLWTNSLKDKVVNFTANFTLWTNSLKNKVVNFTANMTVWKNSLKDKVTNFTANMTKWTNSLKNKVVNFEAKLTSWTDSLKNKTIGFTANLTSWIDSLKNKTINFWANILGKEKGGVYDGNGWKPIQKYASGGTPEGGQMFIARESGPELVGTLGGHTAVMNNNQIVASVSAGVARAIKGIRFYSAGSGSNSGGTENYLPRIADFGNGIRQDLAPIVQMAKNAESAQSNGSIAEMIMILKQILRLLETLDFDVKIDGKSLKDHIVRLINENTQATGVCEITV